MIFTCDYKALPAVFGRDNVVVHDVNTSHELKETFENDMVIFATHNEAHNRMFTATENIVMEKDINNLTLMLRKMSNNHKTYRTRLQLQKDYANEIEHEKLINKINMSLKLKT